MVEDDLARVREALRRGDEDAFAAILGEYWSPVVRFVRTILGDPDLAEDIAQETFVRFWTTRERWQGSGSVEPLLADLFLTDIAAVKLAGAAR